jgi:hypothetical protein
MPVQPKAHGFSNPGTKDEQHRRLEKRCMPRFETSRAYEETPSKIGVSAPLGGSEPLALGLAPPPAPPLEGAGAGGTR